MAHFICPLNSKLAAIARSGRKSFVIPVFLDGEGRPSYGRALWIGPRSKYPRVPNSPFSTSANYHIIVTPKEKTK